MTEKAKPVVGDNGDSWRTGARNATAKLFGVDSTVALRSKSNTRRHSKSTNPSFNRRTPIETLGKTTKDTSASDHSHHWRIDEPNGEFSKGTCEDTNCDATRDFRNWIAEIDFITDEPRGNPRDF